MHKETKTTGPKPNDTDDVPKHLSKRISVHSILHRIETTSDLGFQSQKWTHQKDNGPGHSKLGARNHGY